MNTRLGGRLLLVAIGASGFFLLSAALRRDSPAKKQATPPASDAQPQAGAASAKPAAAEPAGNGEAAAARPRVPPAAATPSPSEALLTDGECADILARAQQLIFQNFRDMEVAQTDLEKYLLAWRNITKLQAVGDKLAANDYKLLPPMDLFTMEGETTDQTVLAFTIPRGVARIDFRRGSDTVVFGVIDACMSNQQAAWDLAVKEFNDKPLAERERLIAAHRQSEAELARLNAEMNASQQASPLETARARHDEIRRLQKDLLPFYVVVPKGQTVAWARRSIGR